MATAAPPEGVRVSVVSAGICASDLHLASFGPSPVVLGHEFAGHLDDGTPVAVLPNVPCGHCDRCRSGQDQQCPRAFDSMYGVTKDGGMADEVWVDASCPRVVPPTLDLGDACLVEPIAVALHGAHRAGVGPGMRVLVVGAGPIGLCAVAAARDLGAVVDLLAHRRRRMEAGEQLGARPSEGSGYDIVLDAAGTQGSFDRAVSLARPGGTIGVLATFWDPVVIGPALLMREITLVPAFTYGHHHGISEFEDAVRLLDATPDIPAALITHHFSLDDAAQAFLVAADRSTDAIKVVLHP